MKIYNQDCLYKLKELKNNSVDSIVTDPPYGLSFMGKKWDYDVPSVEIWVECLRVLKPGGHLLSFAGSRTYHRMAVRIEDAGFEIRDQIMWIYGSGFPKSHNIGKAVDKQGGNSLGKEVADLAVMQNIGGDNITGEIKVTKGNSEWEGWGTALKPAHEPIVMARKLFKGTVVNNVLEWGTGGINIDDSRIATDEVIITHGRNSKSKHFRQIQNHGTYQSKGQKLGRFPANIILDKEAGRILDQQSGVSKSSNTKRNRNTIGSFGMPNDNTPEYSDKGGASRFFYCPKTSKKDRNEGLDEFDNKNGVKQFTSKGGLKCKKCNKWKNSGNPCKCDVPKYEQQQWNGIINKNIHPTVKPTDLMLYLIRLVTSKGGITLDPFMGSGSTGKAAIRGGFDFIGIEREKEYIDIAKARIKYEQEKQKPDQQQKLF